MNSRTAVKLAAMVLGYLAFAVLAAAIVISVHGDGHCDLGPDGGYYGSCGDNPALFGIEVLAYCTGLGLTAGTLGLLMYLKRTGPNPPR